jgi:hypothetical protein
MKGNDNDPRRERRCYHEREKSVEASKEQQQSINRREIKTTYMMCVCV